MNIPHNVRSGNISSPTMPPTLVQPGAESNLPGGRMILLQPQLGLRSNLLGPKCQIKIGALKAGTM